MTINEVLNSFQNVNGNTTLMASAGGTGLTNGGNRGYVGMFHADSAVATTGNYYAVAPNKALSAATNTPVTKTYVGPFAVTASNFYLNVDGMLNSTGGATATRTYTLYKNGVATNLALTVTGGASAYSDTVTQVTFNPGDYASILYSGSGAGAGVTVVGQIFFNF